MHNSTESDQQLLRVWLEQNREDAFRSIVQRYAALVKMTARRICMDDSIAADVCQLTMIELAKKAHSLRHMNTLGGWLHQTAIYQTKNAMRKNSNESRKRTSFLHEHAASHTASGPFSTEITSQLDEALASLDSRDREIIVMRYYRSMDIREIASVVGLKMDAAQKRLNRAIEKLRNKITRVKSMNDEKFSSYMVLGFSVEQLSLADTSSQLASSALASLNSSSLSFSSIFSLKPWAYAIPVTIGGVTLLVAQHKTIARLEQEQPLITQTAASAPQLPTTPRSKTLLDAKPVNWEAIAKHLREAQYAGSSMLDPTAPINSQFDAMGKDGMLKVLDEITTSKLLEDDREFLEVHLCNKIVALPGGYSIVMEKFVEKFHASRWSFTLASYFDEWVKLEPDLAIAWLRRHGELVAEPFRLVSQAVIPRLESDYDTAIRIITAIPEHKRLESLRYLGLNQISPAQLMAWAKMVRQHLPEKDRATAVAWPTWSWSDGDGAPMSFDEAEAYLNSIHATQVEWDAYVSSVGFEYGRANSLYDEAAEKHAAKALEMLRDMVAQKSPNNLAKATGAFLSTLVHYEKSEYDWAIQQALKYHAQTPSDDMLIPLIEKSQSKFPEHARILAERLTEPKNREKYLK